MEVVELKVFGYIINIKYQKNTKSDNLFYIRHDIEEMWLYADYASRDRIKDFCYKAWETSWLYNRYERLYKYTYRFNGFNNSRPIVLEKIEKTESIRKGNRLDYNYICPDLFENSPDKFSKFPVYF